MVRQILALHKLLLLLLLLLLFLLLLLCLVCCRPTAAILLQHNFIRQLKKKPGVESLPEMLMPVTPIKDLASLPVGESSLGDSISKTWNMCEQH